MSHKKANPPRLLQWLIKIFMRSEEMLSIKGDMDEIFTGILEDKGYFSACIWYLSQSICMMPELIRYNLSTKVELLKNYFKIARRNLLRNKTSTIINISGLLIGITCCLLIAFYIQQETSYDSFHKNSDRIYRVAMEITNPKGIERYGLTYTPVAEILKNDYPEIEAVTRIFFRDPQSIKANNKVFYENRVTFADPDFFKVLGFRLLKGTPSDVLASPDSVVISKSIAKKYFGDKNPLGQLVKYNNYKNFKVTGIFDKIPVNSHIDFDFIFPFEHMRDKKIFSYNLGWGLMAPSYTYILTKKGSSIKKLHSDTRGLVGRKTKLPPRVNIELSYQPVKEIHLDSDIRGDYYFPKNTVSRLITIAIIGLFILGIAGFNYMNLATAQATERSREIGIRKIMGAFRRQLIAQFLIESILLTTTAGLLSLILVKIFQPMFSSLLKTEITINYFSNIWIPILTAAFILFLGIISGAYPALYLSLIKPLKTLKSGVNTKKSSSALFRKLLVISQFSICVLLIIGVVVINRQLNYMQNASLGFTDNHNIIVPIPDSSKGKDYQLIKNRLKSINGISSASACRYPLIHMGLLTTLQKNNSSEEGISTHINRAAL